MKTTHEIEEIYLTKKKSLGRESLVSGCGTIAVIKSCWHTPIVDACHRSVKTTLKQEGIPAKHILSYQVPGAWEIPQLAATLFTEQRCNALIALGCVIRGETIHFDLVAKQSSQALLTLATQHHIPTINGILATETLDQAKERALPKKRNCGREFAYALLLLCSTFQNQ